MVHVQWVTDRRYYENGCYGANVNSPDFWHKIQQPQQAQLQQEPLILLLDKAYFELLFATDKRHNISTSSAVFQLRSQNTYILLNQHTKIQISQTDVASTDY